MSIDNEDALKHIPEEYRFAHMDCHHHREAVLKSKNVGCFYCCEIFSPTEIISWTDHDQTAICPRCSIDAILPNIDDHYFLDEMRKYWF
jgi:hypothetical protein